MSKTTKAKTTKAKTTKAKTAEGKADGTEKKIEKTQEAVLAEKNKPKLQMYHRKLANGTTVIDYK